MAFVKGVSGNPGGRAKMTLKDGRSLTDLAREHTVEAVKTLASIMMDRDAPHAARAAASTTLLDRGWGRPAQAITLSGDPENPLAVTVDMSGLTDEQLRTLASIKLGD